MKTVGEAIRLRVELIQRLEEASLSLDPAVRRRLLTFVAVGGGYSGVVTTVGNATHPMIKKLVDQYRLATSRGRLLTEPTLQVKGYQNLWAAGCGGALERWKRVARHGAICAPAGYPVGQEPPGPQSQSALAALSVSGPSEKWLPWGI